jgi:hypothetical protein
MDQIPSLRVQTPLYRKGLGYRLGGRLPGCRLLRGHGLGVIRWSSDSQPDGSHFIKWLFPLDRHLGGISSPFCLGSFRGEGSCLLVGGVRTWLASRPSFISVDLVGARLLSAEQPLEESCRLRPALALLGGVASRLLAQPTFWTGPVFLYALELEELSDGMA